MDRLLAILQQVGTAFLAFVAYSLGARDNAQKTELAQKDAALKSANKALAAEKKYEKIKELAPDSWDTLKRMRKDTKN